MKIGSPRNRNIIASVAVVLLIYLILFPMREYLVGISNARKVVLTGSNAGEPVGMTLRRCYQLDGVCKAYVNGKLRGRGSVSKKPFPLNQYALIFGISLVLLLIYYFTRKTPKPRHTARFSEEEDVANIEISGGLYENPKLDGALILGQFHRLPSHTEEGYRERVLEGVSLPELSKDILALESGYGKRKEIGHMVVSGMTRSRKSTGLTAQLYTWKHSAIVLDTRGELRRMTAGVRNTFGNVYVLSPEGRGNRYNPINELLKLPGGARMAADALVKPYRQARPEFAGRASQGIAATILAAKHYGKEPLSMIDEMVRGGQLKYYFEYVSKIPDKEIRRLSNGFLGMAAVGEDNEYTEQDIKTAFSDRYLQSAWASAMLELQDVLNDNILWMFSGADFKASDLLSESTTLYLDFPETTIGATKNVYDLIVQSIIQCGNRFVDETREKEDSRWYPPSPVFCAFDELSLAPIENLPTIVSTASSRGFIVAVYFQDLSQLEAIYPKQAMTIINNASAQCFYKTESIEAAKYLEKRCGEASIQKRSLNRVINRWFQPMSQSESHETVSVLSEFEALMMGGEERTMLIIIVSGKRPILAHSIAYFENKKLMKKLLSTPPPPMLERGEIPIAPYLLERESEVIRTDVSKPSIEIIIPDSFD